MSSILIPNRQHTHPTKVLLPTEPMLGRKRVGNVAIHRDAIKDAVQGKHADEVVTIAAGSLRCAFGHSTANAMGVPALAKDYQAVPVRVAVIRAAASF